MVHVLGSTATCCACVPRALCAFLLAPAIHVPLADVVPHTWCVRHGLRQGTAAGKGSASSMEFLEEAFKSKTKAGLGDAESLAKGDATKQGATQETSDSKHEKAGQGKSASRGGPKSGDVEIASPGRQASSSVSDGDQADSEDDKIAGFGVTGEEDTVQLALQALSKVRVRDTFMKLEG